MGRTSERKIQRIKELREQGYTQQEIAHELDMDIKTIRAHDPKREKVGTENHQDLNSVQKLLKGIPNTTDNSTKKAQKQQEEMRQLEEKRRQLEEEKVKLQEEKVKLQEEEVRLQEENSDLKSKLSSKNILESELLEAKLTNLKDELKDELDGLRTAVVERPKTEELDEFLAHIEAGELTDKELGYLKRILNDYNRRLKKEGKKLVKVGIEEEEEEVEHGEDEAFVIPGTSILVSPKPMKDSQYDEQHGVWHKQIK